MDLVAQEVIFAHAIDVGDATYFREVERRLGQMLDDDPNDDIGPPTSLSTAQRQRLLNSVTDAAIRRVKAETKGDPAAFAAAALAEAMLSRRMERDLLANDGHVVDTYLDWTIVSRVYLNETNRCYSGSLQSAQNSGLIDQEIVQRLASSLASLQEVLIQRFPEMNVPGSWLAMRSADVPLSTVCDGVGLLRLARMARN